MSQLNGFEATKLILQKSPGDLSIIGLTANSEERLKEEAKAAGQV